MLFGSCSSTLPCSNFSLSVHISVLQSHTFQFSLHYTVPPHKHIPPGLFQGYSGALQVSVWCCEATSHGGQIVLEQINDLEWLLSRHIAGTYFGHLKVVIFYCNFCNVHSWSMPVTALLLLRSKAASHMSVKRVFGCETMDQSTVE